MDKQTRASLSEIISYLFADEHAHWDELGQPKAGHIYCDINRVIEWLDSTESGHK